MWGRRVRACMKGGVCACVRVCVLMRLLYVFVHFRVSVSSYASKTCLDSVKK